MACLTMNTYRENRCRRGHRDSPFRPAREDSRISGARKGVSTAGVSTVVTNARFLYVFVSRLTNSGRQQAHV
jgi:hypothetical protein